VIEERVHVQAARWVVGLGHVVTALLALTVTGMALATVVTWSPVALLGTVLLAGLAGAWHALVRGFDRHRRGAWYGLLAVAAQALVAHTAQLVAGDGPGVGLLLALALDGVVLALLLHPDSREWVARPREAVGTAHG
jgi:hypothetical protein